MPDVASTTLDIPAGLRPADRRFGPGPSNLRPEAPAPLATGGPCPSARVPPEAAPVEAPAFRSRPGCDVPGGADSEAPTGVVVPLVRPPADGLVLVDARAGAGGLPGALGHAAA